MGNRKKLFPVAIILSAVSELAGIAPYILIWLIMRVLLAGSPVQANGNIAAYALWTGIAAVGSVALYFASLACSHLVAFRVETNIRKESMAKVVAMPLGFFDTTTSGRIRKVIDDNAGVTHSFGPPNARPRRNCARAGGLNSPDHVFQLAAGPGLPHPRGHFHGHHGPHHEHARA